MGNNHSSHAHEEEARRRAQEEADRARWAQEEADRTRWAQEEAARVRQAQEEAERAAREAELRAREAEQRAQEARAAREAAERMAREAEEKANEAKAAQEEAERKWKEGILPEVWPTAQEVNAAKERHQYAEGVFHVAIAGIAGSGKSSLINAVRGLHNNDAGAAPAGVVETTAIISRYPDPNPEHGVVWYDVPGAGTLQIPDWEYFNAQGLYIFDCIIVLFDTRFTSTDVAVLKNCARFNIPSYIVRSKSNQHIRNMMEDMGYTSDDDDDRRAELYAAARDKFITETRQSLQINLEDAQLPQQKVYIVAKDSLLSAAKGKAPKNPINEVELIQDLLSGPRTRRRSA